MSITFLYEYVDGGGLRVAGGAGVVPLQPNIFQLLSFIILMQFIKDFFVICMYLCMCVLYVLYCEIMIYNNNNNNTLI